ncbi:hypothetical protein D3C86_1540800 [compost metagenome]
MLQLLGHGTRRLAIGETAGKQQLLAIGGQQAETETAVVFTEADEACGFRRFLLGAGVGLHFAAEGAQANRLTQLREEWRGDLTRFLCTSLEDVFQVGRAFDELVIALARLAQFAIEQLEQTLLGLAPTQALQQLGTELVGLRRGSEGLEQGEQVRVVRILRLTRGTGVGDDARDGVLHLLGAAEQRDGVVVALGHLAPVQAR